MNQRLSGQWSYRGWLAAHSASPQLLRLRHGLAWTLIAAFWLDWAVTAVALTLGDGVQELNPLGNAIYASQGVLGLAGLKAWASLFVLVLSQWVRPRRAAKVLAAMLGVYACVLLWNIAQLVFFL